MPIYEFYCPDCHIVFSFLSRSVDTESRPPCPRCSRKELSRKPSAFAISTGRSAPAADAPGAGVDEQRLEQAMAGLAQQADGVDEKDPKAMVDVLRRFYESTGMPLGKGMNEALQRMAAGEDPEQIEAQMGALLDAEDPWSGDETERTGWRRRLRPPAVDRTLYEL